VARLMSRLMRIARCGYSSNTAMSIGN
jgi:hypothetical protein